jgi:chromatin segregation and condensation protein Rec8/ScpA/Scc1 (kleisin family)
VSFFTLFQEGASRHEITCTFLALLELIRLRQINIKQDRHFGDILIVPVVEEVGAEQVTETQAVREDEESGDHGN